MLTQLTIMSFASVFYGWLWTSPDAHLLDPVGAPLKRWLWEHAYGAEDDFNDEDSSDPHWVWEWLLNRLQCPICMGVDAAVVTGVMLGWHWWESVALVAASAGVHLTYSIVHSYFRAKLAG